MKILHLNHCLSSGGAEVMIIDLAREQKALGHEVTICSLHGVGTLDETAQRLNLQVIHLNISKHVTAQFHAIKNLLTSKRVDIVHMHWGVWLPGALVSRLLKIPCIYTNHGGHSRRTFIQHRLAAKLTSTIVQLTSARDKYMDSWVSVPKKKFELIPNGIDISKFSNANAIEIEGIPKHAQIIGMVGRMCPPKDYSTFISAARLIQMEFPNIHFIAIGDGPTRKQHENYVKQLGVTAFHFLGNRSDVPAIFRRMKINVLATRNEGMPLTLLESFASGCPVVASDIPPVRFVLDNGNCGILVPVGSADALAQALKSLLIDDSLRERLVANGKTRVLEFSAERMAQRYINLYSKLLNKPSKCEGGPQHVKFQ